MSHTLRTVLASVALFIVAYVLLWYAGLFDNLGFDGTIAAVLGVLLTTALAVGLMTAMFHSNRTRHDEDVHRLNWRTELGPPEQGRELRRSSRGPANDEPKRKGGPG